MKPLAIVSVMTQLSDFHRPPELLRFLARHAGLGVVVGCGIASALLVTNVANIGSLLVRSDAPLLTGFLFFSGFAVTFGSVMMGSAVMLLSED